MISRALEPAQALPMLIAAALALAPSPRIVAAQTSSPLAVTPPMGWRSTAACEVTEHSVRAAAEAMSTSGMSRVGYQYVLVGDCWQSARDSDGFIQPDASRFPTGMKALADYVHARGLKLGLYSGAGSVTCAGLPGSRGHEYQDALQYARWGVDYLEYDSCGTDDLSVQGVYTTMRDALRTAKRPMTFHISARGTSQPWKWAATVGHTWRTTDDVAACFTCIEDNGAGKVSGVLPVVDMQDGLRSFSGTGRWNDPGPLKVGTGMSPAEERAQLSLWAMLAAPLTTTVELTAMSESARDLLTNPELIAVDQDILGIQGFRYRADGDLDVWMRPLSRGQLAVLFLNRGKTPLAVTFDWAKHRVRDDLTRKHYDLATTVYAVRDLWTHDGLGTTRAPLSTTLQSHDVMMLRLTPQK